MKIKTVLDLANDEFFKVGIENYFFETRELLAFVLGQTKEWIMTNIEYEISEDAFNKFIEIKNKRIEGIPLQYILGEQYFMGMKFFVNKNVLIPRADTEILVLKVLETLKGKSGVKLLDLCTGSGCIAISLAKKISDAKIFASDISEEALLTAEKNSQLNETSVKFIKSNLFDEIYETNFDTIVSNPPYITGDEMQELSKEVLNEPHLALYGGDDGLYFYKEISKKALSYLKDSGYIAFEIGYSQANSVKNILESLKYKNIEIIKDYSNNDRVIIAQK